MVRAVGPLFMAALASQYDWLGGFAVTTGHGIDAHVRRFKEDADDYSEIMLKALADRLAEAFAEFLHHRVRKELWAYNPDEDLPIDVILREEYQGTRPAAGYPACPDHQEKLAIFELLEVEKRTGIRLTETLAMTPGASVSGLYFAHPESRYFNVGKISQDQVENYALKRGVSVLIPAPIMQPSQASTSSSCVSIVPSANSFIAVVNLLPSALMILP